MTIYTEITPNPATIKFVTSTVLLDYGSLDYPESEMAGDSPLASSLYAFEFTRGVFIGYNFVTVTKEASYSWEELIPRIKAQLKSFLESGEPIAHTLPQREDSPEAEESDVINAIKRLLDENIRPAVAMDGGDVLFDSFKDGVVKIKLQGACSGCPSSTMTLKMGIEGLLTRMIPEVKVVESV